MPVSTTMKPEEVVEKQTTVAGWPVHLLSYRLGDQYVCIVDNVSPGARLARVYGKTREEAEKTALEKAAEMLARTRRLPVD